jgi:hypothetical protein
MLDVLTALAGGGPAPRASESAALARKERVEEVAEISKAPAGRPPACVWYWRANSCSRSIRSQSAPISSYFDRFLGSLSTS